MRYLFDADKVVIKARGENFSARFAREYQVEPERLDQFYTSTFQECLRGKKDLKTEFANLLKELGLDLQVDDILEYWFAAEREVNHKVLDIIAKLRARGNLCFLCTNNERLRTDDLWHSVGLKQHFDGLLASCELGYVKAEAGFWQAVKVQLGLQELSDVMVIDDREDNLETALLAGCQTTLFNQSSDLLPLTTQ